MLAKLEALLKQKMGLDADSIGSPAIKRAVQSRLAACKLDTMERYWECVRDSAAELQALIEAVVVPETWFFRNREAFAALAQIAQELPARPVLRLLSLPCSTGEEPYSMAMALLDAGVAPSGFRIDGLDISRQVLEDARHGIYGRNSFRGRELSFRDRYFEPAGQFYAVADTVRRQVQFHQWNLFDAAPLPATERYDVIFCRNLLIYFDPAGQDQAVRTLDRLLAPGGYLFVGPSETGVPLARGYVSARRPLAFAFHRAKTLSEVSPPRLVAPPTNPLPPPLR